MRLRIGRAAIAPVASSGAGAELVARRRCAAATFLPLEYRRDRAVGRGRGHRRKVLGLRARRASALSPSPCALTRALVASKPVVPAPDESHLPGRAGARAFGIAADGRRAPRNAARTGSASRDRAARLCCAQAAARCCAHVMADGQSCGDARPGRSAVTRHPSTPATPASVPPLRRRADGRSRPRGRRKWLTELKGIWLTAGLGAPSPSVRAGTTSRITCMPCALSFRHGMAAKFTPPLALKISPFSTAISSSVSRQSAEKPGVTIARFFTPLCASASTVLSV